MCALETLEQSFVPFVILIDAAAAAINLHL